MLEFPAYEPPAWVADDDRPPAASASSRSPSRLAARRSSALALVAGGDRSRTSPLPLLVVHDGPEYAESRARCACSTTSSRRRAAAAPRRAAAAAGRPQRDATPPRRATPARSRRVLPRARERAPTRRPPVAAWARASARSPLLHAHWHAPERVRRRSSCSRAASSGRASTRTSRGFPRFARITRFVGRVARRARRAAPIPVDDHLRHRRGEPRQQPRRRATRCRAAATTCASSSTATRTTGSAGATRSTRTCPSCSQRAWTRHVELVAERSARRRRRRLRPLRPAAARVPVAAGAALGLGGAAAWSTRSRALIEAGRRQALLRRLLRRAAAGATTALPLEERARRHGAYERWIARPRRAVHPRRLRRLRRRSRVTGAQLRRLPRGQLRAQPRRPLPARDLPVRRLRRRRCVGWGERGDAVYFNNPMDYVAPPRTATTSTGCARSVSLLLVVRPGPVGGHDRARSSRRAASPRCSAEKGIRHELDLWGHDVPHDWPSWRAQIAHHLPRFCLMPEPPDRPAARHRGGLADRVRGARRAAARRSSTAASAHASATERITDRAVRPARQAALRARDRPARLVVRPRRASG